MFIFSSKNKFKRLAARHITKLLVILSLSSSMGNVLAQSNKVALANETRRTEQVGRGVFSDADKEFNDLRQRAEQERNMAEQHLSRFNQLYTYIENGINNKSYMNEKEALKLKSSILTLRKYFNHFITDLLEPGLFKFYNQKTGDWLYLAKNNFSEDALRQMGKQDKKEIQNAFDEAAGQALKDSIKVDHVGGRVIKEETKFSHATLSHESNKDVRTSEYSNFLNYIKQNKPKWIEVSGKDILVQSNFKDKSAAEESSLCNIESEYVSYVSSKGEKKGISNLFTVKGHSESKSGSKICITLK